MQCLNTVSGGKALSESTPNARVAFVGFGSHLRNIIRDVAKQRYIISFTIHDTVAGAKGDRIGKKNEFYLKIGKTV